MIRKKILILILFLSFSNSYASEFKTNFTKELFEDAQKSGKTIVLYSWNKYCTTCAKQKLILEQAKNDFKDVLFIYVEHAKNKKILKEMNIKFWSTIAIYKGNKQIANSIGLVDKIEIYSLIKKGT